MCILNNCHNKAKYGEYCYKHRRNHLVDKDRIIIERWTNKCSDYLKDDIIHHLKLSYLYGSKLINKSKKELFILLSEKINTLQIYGVKDVQKIISIQKKFKYKKQGKLNKLRGSGLLNKRLSNNDNDFFTYDSRDEIDDKYYFSYKDE